MNAENNIHEGLSQRKNKITTIVRDLLHGDRRPNAVHPTPRGYTFEFGEDARGGPGVWIYITIDDDTHPSKEKINELNEFAKLITDNIIEADLGFWPYIEYVNKNREL
jgi:hypothetical protein